MANVEGPPSEILRALKGRGDDNPMKVARRAKFLKDYRGVRRGGD